MPNEMIKSILFKPNLKLQTDLLEARQQLPMLFLIFVYVSVNGGMMRCKTDFLPLKLHSSCQIYDSSKCAKNANSVVFTSLNIKLLICKKLLLKIQLFASSKDGGTFAASSLQI